MAGFHHAGPGLPPEPISPSPASPRFDPNFQRYRCGISLLFHTLRIIQHAFIHVHPSFEIPQSLALIAFRTWSL